MSEHVKEDLQQKIQEILEDKEEKEVITEDTAEIVDKKVSDREWYKNSLYESLVKKWAK